MTTGHAFTRVEATINGVALPGVTGVSYAPEHPRRAPPGYSCEIGFEAALELGVAPRPNRAERRAAARKQRRTARVNRTRAPVILPLTPTPDA